LVGLTPPQAQARSSIPAMVPATITLATARILAQNLLGGDLDDKGNIVFGSADQDLAPAMALRRDFWGIEIALIAFCSVLSGSKSAIAKWARIARLVFVLLGISLTLGTIATLLPQLTASLSTPPGT